MNSSPFFIWKARNSLKAAIRAFFNQRSYLEVDTPIAVPCPGSEVHLNYFKTTWQDYHQGQFPYWLRSSPELHMKQILALGSQDIFQLAPCFRNGGERSPWHHPEFLLLEWYRCGNDFSGFIDETYELLRYTLAEVRQDLALSSQTLELPAAKIPKITLAEAFQQFAGIELIDDDRDLARKARSQGVRSVGSDDDFETAYFKVLLEKIEPRLEEFPAIALYNYPPSQAALAKVSNNWAQRFEVYIKGIELSNGFHELVDLQENRRRFHSSNAQRAALGKEITAEDEGFWDALATGLPESCGNALGVERWLALLLGEKSLESLIPFRTRQFTLR
jgi:lysyl-tRNA synthetase class 2